MSDPKKAGPSGRSPRRTKQPPRPVERDEAPRRAAEPPEPPEETEGYTLQVFYDPDERLFRANFLEFPDVRVSDESRSEAIYAAEEKLHSRLAALRQGGQAVPEPARVREYPTHLELPISQPLYRRLEIRRHQERVSMDQLVTEILTAACERKQDSGDRGDRGSGGRDRRGGQASQGKGRGQEGRGRGNRRNFHETMESRENFMEYVRNLEKGGGPGYKKR